MSIKVYALENGLAVRELIFFQTGNSLDEISRQLPQGLYSTFRTYSSAQRVLGLRAHLERLYVPAGVKGIEPSLSAIELRKQMRTLLQAFRPGEARVRVCLSLSEQPGQVFMMLESLKLLDETNYQNGIKIVTTKVERADPRLKTTAFIEKSEAERKSILQNGYFEALMVHHNYLLEGLTSNFYAVKDRVIITARQGILLGVTRRVLLRLARENGLEIEYRPLRLNELSGIDEAFISSSSRGVVPVVEIDAQPVGTGRVGSVARLLRRAYNEYVLKKAEEI